MFLIDHDMGLVLNVCDYIYVLDFGQIIAEGTPAEVRSRPGRDRRLPRRVRRRGAGQGRRGARGAHRRQPPATRPDEHPTRRGDHVMSRAPPGVHRSMQLQRAARRLRRHPRRARPQPDGRLRRGGRAARPERCRQDHHAAHHLGSAAARSQGTVRCSARRSTASSPYKIARRGLAHVAEDRSLFFELTVDENIKLGLTGDTRRSTRPRTTGRWSCCRRSRRSASRLAGLLSGGEQQMLAMARALVSRTRSACSSTR